MALYYDLPVYRDTYQLILKIFEVTKDFPKDYKYTLGQDMKRDALQLVRSIYRANKSARKKEHLETLRAKACISASSVLTASSGNAHTITHRIAMY
jgi:hypothetical protein